MTKEVSSLELCQQLKEAGWKQESLLCYDMNWDKERLFLSDQLQPVLLCAGEKSPYIAAPTVVEMVEWLDEYGDIEIFPHKTQSTISFYPHDNKDSHTTFELTLPDALAQMVLWVLEKEKK